MDLQNDRRSKIKTRRKRMFPLVFVQHRKTDSLWFVARSFWHSMSMRSTSAQVWSAVRHQQIWRNQSPAVLCFNHRRHQYCTYWPNLIAYAILNNIHVSCLRSYFIHFFCLHWKGMLLWHVCWRQSPRTSEALRTICRNCFAV